MSELNLVGIVCVSSLVLGAGIYFGRGSLFKNFKIRKPQRLITILLLQSLAIQSFALAMLFVLTRNLNISLPISIVISYLPRIHARARERKLMENRRKSWPLVIDQLASAVASGVPLHSALSEMVNRGPTALQEEFLAFQRAFLREGSLERGLAEFIEMAQSRGEYIHSQSALQLKSTLLIARDCGGQDVGPILRNLGTHLRQRERVYDEIAIRQDWIRNGAVLASVTPWLLLLVLSLNSQTHDAYKSSDGRLVLMVGLITTFIAYLWINRISHAVISTKVTNKRIVVSK